jgi:hypothetical protein
LSQPLNICLYTLQYQQAIGAAAMWGSISEVQKERLRIIILLYKFDKHNQCTYPLHKNQHQVYKAHHLTQELVFELAGKD